MNSSIFKSKNPQQGVRWVQGVYKDVKAKVCLSKPLMLKEIGFPTGGENWATEKNQETFLKLMDNKSVPFCFFEAFDQPWKGSDGTIEPHWGIFFQNRTPKAYAQTRTKKRKPN